MSQSNVDSSPVTMGSDSKREFGLKLFRVDMKGKIMDVTDPNPAPVVFNPDHEGSRIPRIALNYTRYNLESFKAECKHTHWLDVDALRLLAWDLMTNRKGDKTDKGYTAILDEFKGGPASAAGITTLGENGIISRQLTISFNDTLNMGPVYQFNFVVKEGKKGDKGQITPVSGGEVFVKEQLNVPVGSARKMGARLHAYLQSKEAAAIATHAWTK